MKYNFTLKYLPSAGEDILLIAEYLNQFNKGTTSRFLAELESRISSLAQLPYQCEEYADDSFYRKLVISDYIVFYHVDDTAQAVEIHRIFHASRNIRKILDEQY